MIMATWKHSKMISYRLLRVYEIYSFTFGENFTTNYRESEKLFPLFNVIFYKANLRNL